MIKRFLILLICLTGIFSTRLRAQATTTMSIDSISILSPVLMGGFTDFGVQVRVNNFIGADSLFGDIFYYYLTDSMMNAGDSARIFLLDAVNEPVVDPFIDTVSIDILPNEIRTSGPMNLIVIWPAMINPAVVDTDSITIYLAIEGYVGLPPVHNAENKNIIFPSPTLQFLYIKQDEVERIKEIMIINSLGQEVGYIPSANLGSGMISIESLKAGNYTAVIYYLDGDVVTMKFIKQ